MKQFKAAIVEWEDAGYMNKHDLSRSVKPFSMTSIGFILSNDTHRLMLGTVIPDDGNDCGVLIIPQGNIKKIRRLYEKVSGKERVATNRI